MSLLKNNLYNIEDFYSYKFKSMIKYLDTIKNIKSINKDQSIELKNLFDNMIDYLFDMSKCQSDLIINNNPDAKDLFHRYKQEGINKFTIKECYKIMTLLYCKNDIKLISNKLIIDKIANNPSKSIFIPKGIKTLCIFAILNGMTYYDLKRDDPNQLELMKNCTKKFENMNIRSKVENIIIGGELSDFMKFYILDVLYLFILKFHDTTTSLENFDDIVHFYTELEIWEIEKLEKYESLVQKSFYKSKIDSKTLKKLIDNYLSSEDFAFGDDAEEVKPRIKKTFKIVSYPFLYILK